MQIVCTGLVIVVKHGERIKGLFGTRNPAWLVYKVTSLLLLHVSGYSLRLGPLDPGSVELVATGGRREAGCTWTESASANNLAPDMPNLLWVHIASFPSLL